MSYSNENDRHSELWTYGSAAFRVRHHRGPLR